MHYKRWVRNGDPTTVQYIQGDDLARLLSKVDKDGPGGCWLWTGSLDHAGYGDFWRNRRSDGAHRSAYELLVGPIPNGLQLDHLCRVRRCVNPDHLEPVTGRENVLRSESIPAHNARKSSCNAGHPFDETNTYWYQGERNCRECRRESWRRWNARRRAS